MKDKHNMWTRLAIERGSGTPELGSFRAVLATSGEAADGHILSVDGMRVPDSMPMLFRHQSTADIPTLGRIVSPSKSTEEGTQLLRVTGAFDLEGEADDPLLAIRRGFASLVQQGSLDAMSVRWDPVFGKFVSRSSLPNGHFARVERSSPNAHRRFYEESVALEGSIVAIGADAGALMGRADMATSDVECRAFTLLAGELAPEDATHGLDAQYVPLIEAMRAMVVEEIAKRDSVMFEYMREHDSDLGENLTDVERLKDLAQETSREVPVETKETETTKEPEVSRTLDGEGLRSLIRETAAESVSRKIDNALGRITR